MECKIFVKHFSRATTTCMRDYMKPSLRNAPKHFILHIGINDHNIEQSSESIAQGIPNLADSSKNDYHDISMLNIVIRIENVRLNGKRCEFNPI